MAVIGIRYDGCDHTYDDNGNRIELNPSNLVYESVYLYSNDGDFIFDSGNFPKDWYNAKKKYQELMDVDPHFSHSSSVDDFIIDGGNFDSGYLHIVDGNLVLKYVDETDENYFLTQRHIFEEGWEFFVPKGTTPTWEELKKSCQ